MKNISTFNKFITESNSEYDRSIRLTENNKKKAEDLLNNPFSKLMDPAKLAKKVGSLTKQIFFIKNSNEQVLDLMTDFAELSLDPKNQDVMVEFYIDDDYCTENKTAFMTDFDFSRYKLEDKKSFWHLKNHFTEYIRVHNMQTVAATKEDMGVLPISRSADINFTKEKAMYKKFWKMLNFFIEIDNMDGTTSKKWGKVIIGPKDYMPSDNFYVIQNKNDDSDIKLVPKGFLKYLK